MEFALHGLAEFSQLSKHRFETGIQFKDLLGSMMNFGTEESPEGEEDLN
jgi:magnesium chelatase subunit I